jgi:hypothetical protein
MLQSFPRFKNALLAGENRFDQSRANKRVSNKSECASQQAFLVFGKA